MVSAYLYPHASGTCKLAVTAIGQSVPDNGIEIYRLTIPAGSTDATTTPILPTSRSPTCAATSQATPICSTARRACRWRYTTTSRGTDWRMDIDVVSFTGAPCRADQIVITNRATNGCAVAWVCRRRRAHPLANRPTA